METANHVWPVITILMVVGSVRKVVHHVLLMDVRNVMLSYIWLMVNVTFHVPQDIILLLHQIALPALQIVNHVTVYNVSYALLPIIYMREVVIKVAQLELTPILFYALIVK